MSKPRARSSPEPLDQQALKQLALHYVGRYATTRSKLADYLQRKVRQRGWDDERGPDAAILALAEDMAMRGYIDEALFAGNRRDSMLRRGYGKRRIVQALKAAGIDDAMIASCVDEHADEPPGYSPFMQPEEELDFAQNCYRSALKLAQRKKLGPWSLRPREASEYQRQLRMMLRAGHDFDTARQILAAETAEELEAGLDLPDGAF